MNEVTKKEFTHLKIHTQYSICEGALRTSDLAKYCKINKIKAVGLCDSNNLCGALEFSESIAKSKTQPIIGTQINIQYKGHSGKIPLFAKDLEGYKNLIKLSSKSFLEIKDDEEPHCKIEDLEKTSKGLILLTGSLDGFFGKLISKNLTLKELSELYGSCDAYVSSYRAEGFNMPPLEAAACGIPTILTSGGSTDDYYDPSFVLKIEGTKKTLNDGKNYIEPDLESLISNMSNLIEKRNSLLKKNKAISFIEKNFTWKLISKKLSDLFIND